MKKSDLVFKCTCDCSPEQYDVFDANGKYVAYVRLRYGRLRVSFSAVELYDVIYEHCFDDNWMGRFDNDEQREKYMKKIRKKIVEYHQQKEKATVADVATSEAEYEDEND